MKEQNNFSGGIIFLLIAAVLGFLSYRYYGKYVEQKNVSDKLTISLNSLTDTAKTYRVKWLNGEKLNAASVNALYLKNENLERLYKDEIRASSRLGAKLRDISSLTTTKVVTRDSVINVPVYLDTLQALHADYSDEWANINCTINRKFKADIRYEVRDSLFITEYYKKHRILFGLIHWKEKQNRYVIVSMNPKSKIVGFSVKKVIE